MNGKARYSIYYWDGRYDQQEHCKTKEELELMMQIIKEDESITRAYAIDHSNGKQIDEKKIDPQSAFAQWFRNDRPRVSQF